MKKIVTLLMLICLLTSLFAVANANPIVTGWTLIPETEIQTKSGGCNGDHVYIVLYSHHLGNEFRYCDKYYHQERNLYEAFCEDCPVVQTAVVLEDPVSHTWTLVADQHMEGKSRHRFDYECRICDGTKSELDYCSGGSGKPCPVFLNRIAQPVDITE